MCVCYIWMNASLLFWNNFTFRYKSVWESKWFSTSTHPFPISQGHGSAVTPGSCLFTASSSRYPPSSMKTSAGVYKIHTKLLAQLSVLSSTHNSRRKLSDNALLLSFKVIAPDWVFFGLSKNNVIIDLPGSAHFQETFGSESKPKKVCVWSV